VRVGGTRALGSVTVTGEGKRAEVCVRARASLLVTLQVMTKSNERKFQTTTTTSPVSCDHWEPHEAAFSPPSLSPRVNLFAFHVNRERIGRRNVVPPPPATSDVWERRYYYY